MILRAVRRLQGSLLRHDLVVSTLKCTVAVVLAWVLAHHVIGSPEAFLAPYTALFLIGTTVQASASAAVRQVAVVALGVAIAALPAAFLPLLPGLAITVAVATLVGRVRYLSPDGSWVAISAVLVLLYGTATDTTAVLYRIGDVALGALVGVVVNAVVMPPDHLRTARDLILTRAHAIADVLADLAAAARDGGGDTSSRHQQIWGLITATSAVDALGDARASLRGNIRRHGWTKVGGPHIYDPVATALDNAVIYLSALALGIDNFLDAGEDGPDTDGGRGEHEMVAEALDALAATFTELTWDPAHHHIPYATVIGTTVPRTTELIGELEAMSRRSGSAMAAAPVITALRGLVTTLTVLDRQPSTR